MHMEQVLARLLKTKEHMGNKKEEPTLIWILVSVLGGVRPGAAARPGARPGAARALKAGQSIREVGPKWHQGKAGTPTIGRHRLYSVVAFVHRHRLACHARDRRL